MVACCAMYSFSLHSLLMTITRVNYSAIVKFNYLFTNRLLLQATKRTANSSVPQCNITLCTAPSIFYQRQLFLFMQFLLYTTCQLQLITFKINFWGYFLQKIFYLCFIVTITARFYKKNSIVQRNKLELSAIKTVTYFVQLLSRMKK